VVLFCDHASGAVPAALARLGVDESVLKRHISWDIGAGDVTRRLAALIDAPAVLAGFSRLVIDCNRPLDSPGSIPRMSDGIAIPGNGNVEAAEAEERAHVCFWPYHDAVDETITRVGERSGVKPLVVSMHSYTPVMDGFERPWHVGVLWDHDADAGKVLIDMLAADPAVCVGDNQPYSGRVPVPYSIPSHAVARQLPHVTVEIRQDLIDTHHGAEAWANLLAAAIGKLRHTVGLSRAADS
jgi:predicted N-formylglutamate amidohydrolase